jgi:hypothetical protein
MITRDSGTKMLSRQASVSHGGYLEYQDKSDGPVRAAMIEDCAATDPPSPKRLEEWKTVWTRCTLFEKRFWDMAMELS